MNVARRNEPEPRVSAVDVQIDTDDDAILLFVGAINNTEEVDRRFPHHLESAPKPGFPGVRPGVTRRFIGAAVQCTAFPFASKSVCERRNLSDESLDSLGRKVWIVFCRFNRGVMGAVCTGVFSEFSAFSAHTTARQGDPA
jgi:hypothetical protein